MNKIDEYWFWVSLAITAPNNNKKHFYFNKLKHQLFGFIQNNNNQLPIFRNEMTKNDKGILEKFKDCIYQKSTNPQSIILLPRLSLDEKRDFLSKFAKSISNSTLKNQLIIEASLFSENDEFEFKTRLKEEDKVLFFDFDMKRGQFVSLMVKKYFNPIGISESTTVIW